MKTTRARLGLATLATIVVGLAMPLWSRVDEPPPRPGTAPAGAPTSATVATAPWGHDPLRAPATGAKPAVGPGISAFTVALSTQRPFEAPPASAPPPTLPAAYGAAWPQDARGPKK